MTQGCLEGLEVLWPLVTSMGLDSGPLDGPKQKEQGRDLRLYVVSETLPTLTVCTQPGRVSAL